ncbi:MAG: hypothetical protein KDB37_17445 [Ilumatobacter sp.]|nr:hypothetical protein [Ilumatobacter sp.]
MDTNTATLIVELARAIAAQPAAPAAPGQSPPPLPFDGMTVIVRTVTMIYTGRATSVGSGWIRLDDAAWIADTGRWAAALATGKLNEVEPYPGGCWVRASSIVDVAPWSHDLPRGTK